MRRLFIMRKDLNMSAGKLAAQVGHCAEAYWTRGLRAAAKIRDDFKGYNCTVVIPLEVYDGYVNASLLTGIWLKPLDDDTAHAISKKYQLYK